MADTSRHHSRFRGVCATCLRVDSGRRSADRENPEEQKTAEVAPPLKLIIRNGWRIGHMRRFRDFRNRRRIFIRFDRSLANLNTAMLIVDEHVRAAAAYAAGCCGLLILILNIESMEVRVNFSTMGACIELK